MYKYKPSVILEGVKPETEHLIDIAEQVYADYGFSLVVTSVMDGVHKQGSKHYEGYAADFRIWGMSKAMMITIIDEMKARLGPNYDVILENDHIHAEYDPK